MAAKHLYQQGLVLLLLHVVAATTAWERRFSDFKRCADQECSMLLCRGKAEKDWSGPDCRFLSFKKSETVYVYYKLSGRRADLWAGSVGSNFGYFPKDLLAVNHIYTDKELEIPAQVTDFVCFDTGFDKFDNYDVDLLMASLAEENVSEYSTGTFEQIQETKSPQTEPEPSVEQVTQSEKQTEHHEGLDKVQKDQSTTLPELHSSIEDLESNTKAVPAGEEKNKQTLELESVLENGSERSETKYAPAESEVDSVPKGDLVNEPVSISEGREIPKFETTLGTTFDAVTSDDEITTKVTPYPEEDSGDVDHHPEEDIDDTEAIPLLSSSEETGDAAASDSLPKHERIPITEDDDDKQKMTEEKNMWTSLGDAVFSVVTGGETTGEDMSSDEDDDDDDDEDLEEKADVTTPHIFENEESKPQGDPANMEQIPEDLSNASVVQQNNKESKSDPDRLFFDGENESDRELTGHEEAQNETFKSTDESIEDQMGKNILSEDPISQDDIYINPNGEKLDNETHEPTEEKADEVSKHLDLSEEESYVQDSIVVTEQVVDVALDRNKTVTDQELAISESGKDPHQSREKRQSEDLEFKDDKFEADEMHDHLVPDVESNSSFTGLSVEDLDHHKSSQMDEREAENDAGTQEEEDKEREELLEDENALSSSETDYVYSDETSPETTQSPPEPQYSDSVMRLTLLRDHFTEEKMDRVQNILGLNNLFKVEAMFSDMDTELQVTRMSQAGTTQDIENALERILETSENAILDEIEKMLDSRDSKKDLDQKTDPSIMDEETELLDDIQELAFSLRKKYSTVSDSAPLETDKSDDVRDEPRLTVDKDVHHVYEERFDSKPETDQDDNLTVTDHKERPDVIEKEQIVPDVNVEEDGKHFNKNKDLQGFGAVEDMQKGPQTTLENPLDMGLVAEVEQSSAGSMDPVEPVTEKHEEEVGLLTTGAVYMGCIFSIIKNKTEEWSVVVISLLPEEWRPGKTLFGCPWEAVVTTSFVGVLTFTLFFWRTVLAVKKKIYLVDEKKLNEQIQALKKQKNEALAKISQLKMQTEELRENQKESKETVTCTMKKMQHLEGKMTEAERLNEQMAEERKEYAKLLEEERAASVRNETRIEKLEKSNEKLQLSRKKTQEALAKTTTLLDEAKIREDARNAQHKCLQKEYTAFKEENKTLKATIKGWEDKHKELNEKIKVYQKSQKELEDSVVLKDHNVEVLSELLADLEACDVQKGDTKVLANGELAADKKTAIRNRIKLMMDVSRVQTTLAVVEEERDRFMAKLLNEEKSRKEQEEKHRELAHEIGTIKSEKSHVENQFKILQQKNEIMVEMYQQKENALQQRLTQEELERRSKENLLSEVGGKAVEAEEQVKILRQRINEMESQMKKTEEVYKEQIKEQENKTHSNWVNARNAERALSQEKLEASKLREKLAVLTSQLNERRAPLFRPNSGQPGALRQGDSYGPSPVSGGAPSPPLMIEGPRRPPSAPIGRRIDPYGPRPPSDPHGRYAENKHIPGMDMMGPRSSSPANLDGSTQAVDPQIKAETQAVASTESQEPGPGSFIASPIRDSPGAMVHGPPPGPGGHDPLLPPGPHGRLPPPGPYRSPRQGHYQLPPGALPPNVPPPLPGPHLPPNGHPGMPPPGPMGGDFGPRPANGLAFHPRPGPGHVMDPRGPPPPHFRPPPHHFGPIPPPHGIRGPLGPRPPFPPDMRFTGVPPHPTHPGEGYGPAPANALQNSAGGQSGPGQDLHVKQEASQDSARPASAKP
ncbi:transport and Golgi organization protein 1 homolog [Cololabis saira]|uniref:transport and Golgi organization protein 1 homolog n=1 Tax=Cololabis saira TaxID=129043 RepID=UPI002AD31DDE|nr:transport and Golgi organization protein 1 homolog [Cololabis saira]